MASIATLTYSSQHPVQISWGDGTVQVHPAAPPPSTNTVTHTFDGPGPWNVVLTDTVNGLSSSRSLLCSTCDITGAVLATNDPASGAWTIGPIINGSGGNVLVDWGDGSTPQTVASGSTGTHTYIDSAGPGPFVVTVTDPAVPGCQASVTGGNDPENPGGATIIRPPVLSVACTTAGTNGEDRVQVTITGPDDATYTIAWGDGATDSNLAAGTHTHQYALPAGIARNIHVTQLQTAWSGLLSVTCEVPPLISAFTCDFIPDCIKEPATPVHQLQPPTNVTFGPATQSWNVDWGDGTTVVSVAAGTTANHTYPTPPIAITARYLVVFTSPTNPACFDQVQVSIFIQPGPGYQG